jgi:hypothetical protein
VQVQYHVHPTIQLPGATSFRLDVFARDSFAILPDNDMAEPMKPDLRKAVAYLNNLQGVNYETLANADARKDSVLATQAFCTISVTDVKGVQRSIDIYYKPVTKRTKMQYDPSGNPLPYDRERFYAVVNEGRDFVIIQEFVFGKLMANYEWFLPQD